MSDAISMAEAGEAHLLAKHLLGLGFCSWNGAKFVKAVRVKHVSEVPATRVAVWPGEGSAGAACRKRCRKMKGPVRCSA